MTSSQERDQAAAAAAGLEREPRSTATLTCQPGALGSPTKRRLRSENLH